MACYFAFWSRIRPQSVLSNQIPAERDFAAGQASLP